MPSWLIAVGVLLAFVLWAGAALPGFQAVLVGGALSLLGLAAARGGWRWLLATVLLIGGTFAVLVAIDEYQKSNLAGPPAEVRNAASQASEPFRPDTTEPSSPVCKELEHDSYRCAITIDPNIRGVREDIEMVVNVYPDGQTFVSDLTRTEVPEHR